MANLLTRTPQFEVLDVGEVFVVRWFKAPTVAALLQVEEAMNGTIGPCKNAFAWLTLSCPEQPPEPEFSKAASEQIDRMKSKGLCAIAAVQETDTLGGKLARISMQVIIGFTRTAVRVRIFGNAREACAWLEATVPGVRAAALEKAIAQPGGGPRIAERPREDRP